MKVVVDIIAIRVSYDALYGCGYCYEIPVDFHVGPRGVTHRRYEVFDSDYTDSQLRPLDLLGWLTDCINESREIPAHKGKWIA